MEVIAYRVNDGEQAGYIALPGNYGGQKVPAGTRVYGDPLFRNFLAEADGSDWEWTGQGHEIFTRPNLTANGTMGGDAFAVSCDLGTAWYAFDANKTGTMWSTGWTDLPHTLAWYNPLPLVITKITVTNGYNYTDYGACLAGKVQTSDNGSTWVDLQAFTNTVTAFTTPWDIEISAPRAARYYRIYCTESSYWDRGKTIMMCDVAPEGFTYQLVEPTVSEFDDAHRAHIPAVTGAENFKPHALYAPTIVGYVYAYHAELGSLTGYSSHEPTIGGEFIPSATPIYSDVLLTAQIATATGSDWKVPIGAQVPWVQPVCTANNDPSGIVFSATNNQSGELAFKAMDGIKSGTTDLSWWGTTTSSATWQAILPYFINITKVVHYGRLGAYSTTGTYYTDAALTNAIGSTFTNAGNWAQTVVYDSVTPISTDRIYFRKTATTNGGIGELEITATVNGTLEPVVTPIYGTSPHVPLFRPLKLWAHHSGNFYERDDAPSGAYPFTTKDYEGLLQAIAQGGTLEWDPETQRPWVYRWDVWEQPALTSATSYGTLTSLSQYSAAYAGYCAFDNKTTTDWACLGSTGGTQWLLWELPCTIRISQCRYTQRSNSVGATDYANTAAIYASSDKQQLIAPETTLTRTWGVTTVLTCDDSVATNVLYIEVVGYTAGGFFGAREIAFDGLFKNILHEVL